MVEKRMEIHSVGPFIIGKTLGQGTTGKVKLGFHKDTGFKVGIKIINKDLLNNKPSMRRKIEREVVLMKLIDHPNALKMYEVYETSNYLFLILEYVEGGELFDYLVEKGGLESGEALFFFQQIIGGLDYCHSRNICHRDLKPENLLLSGDKKIKICDFGMGSIIKKDSLLHTSCGSPHYASPEVVSGIDYDGQKTDVWSCGVILYALLTGRLPFDDDNIRRLLSKVKSGDFVMPAYIHKDAQDLLTKMLIVDPKKRISIKDIKKHPWFLSNTVQIQKSIPVDEIVSTPLPDLSVLDDEIFRSLMVLGLGSVDEVKKALVSNEKSQILVYYRLLEERKKYDTEGNKYGVKIAKSASGNDKRRNSASELSLRRMFGKQKSATDINPPSPHHPNGIPPPLNLSNSNNSISQQQPSQQQPSSQQQQQSPRQQISSSEGLLKQALQQHHHQQQQHHQQYHQQQQQQQQQNTYGSSPLSISVSDKLPSIQTLHINNSPNSIHYPSNTAPKNIVPPLSLSQAIPPPSTPKEPIQRRGSMTATSNPATSPTISHRGKTSSPIEITKVRKLKLQESATPNSPIIGSSPKKSWFSYFFSKGSSSNNLKSQSSSSMMNGGANGATTTTTTTTSSGGAPATPTLVVETRIDSSLIVVNLEKVFTKLGIEWKLKSNHSQISYSLKYPTSSTVSTSYNTNNNTMQDGAGHSTLYECDIEVDKSATNDTLNRIYIVKKSGSNGFFSSLTNSIEQLFI